MKLAITTIFSTLMISYSYGQNTGGKDLKPILEGGIEYLYPIHDNRQIHTISCNFLYGWERFDKHPFTFQFGLTATRAWGNIIQLDSSFSEVKTDNKAIGIGPVFVVEYEPFVYKNFSVSPVFSGGIILYSNRFPHGGDIYNFMWRFGGAIHYGLKNKTKISLSGKWMHVSNGQGLSPKNPSYEGMGIEISITKYLHNIKQLKI